MSIASTANEHSEEFRPALRQLPTKAGTGIKILNCGVTSRSLVLPWPVPPAAWLAARRASLSPVLRLRPAHRPASNRIDGALMLL